MQGQGWGEHWWGTHKSERTKEESPSSESANIILLKQLALRKILLKKKKNKLLIEILFCKHIKNCQILNILNAHENVHRWATFLFTLV